MSRSRIDADDNFEDTFCFRLMDNDANVTMRLGMGQDPSANPPSNGIYLEKLAADTQWFGVCRSGGTETRTASLATCDTNYHEIKLRRVTSTTISFTLDNGSEMTLATNVPTVALNPFAHIVNTAAANKRLRFDWYRTRIGGLA